MVDSVVGLALYHRCYEFFFPSIHYCSWNMDPRLRSTDRTSSETVSLYNSHAFTRYRCNYPHRLFLKKEERQKELNEEIKKNCSNFAKKKLVFIKTLHECTHVKFARTYSIIQTFFMWKLRLQRNHIEHEAKEIMLLIYFLKIHTLYTNSKSFI